jgi:hypothetical protein
MGSYRRGEANMGLLRSLYKTAFQFRSVQNSRVFLERQPFENTVVCSYRKLVQNKMYDPAATSLLQKPQSLPFLMLAWQSPFKRG